MMNAVKINTKEIGEILNGMPSNAVFGITFTKKNGEERTYERCRVHYYPKSEDNGNGNGFTKKKSHISARENFEKNGVVVFFAEDVNGFRSCKYENIVNFEIKEMPLHEVI